MRKHLKARKYILSLYNSKYLSYTLNVTIDKSLISQY